MDEPSSAMARPSMAQPLSDDLRPILTEELLTDMGQDSIATQGNDVSSMSLTDMSSGDNDRGADGTTIPNSCADGRAPEKYIVPFCVSQKDLHDDNL